MKGAYIYGSHSSPRWSRLVYKKLRNFRIMGEGCCHVVRLQRSPRIYTHNQSRTGYESSLVQLRLRSAARMGSTQTSRDGDGDIGGDVMEFLTCRYLYERGFGTLRNSTSKVTDVKKKKKILLRERVAFYFAF